MARNQEPIDQIDWAALEETWKGFGPDRTMRQLQAYISKVLGFKLDLQTIVNEATKRNWQVRALEFDKRLTAEVDKVTAESLIQSLVTSRLKGIQNVSRRADKIGEALDKYIDGAMSRIGRGKFDPAELNALVNAYAKLEGMKQDMEVPTLPDAEEDDAATINMTPEKMAEALLHIAQGRNLSIAQLHDPKLIDLKPNEVS